MSKLTDKLHQLGRTTPAPMGFGRRVAPERTPAMLLIAEVDAAANSGQATSHADALLLKRAPSEDEAKALGDQIWGVASESATEEELDRLKEAGCDFVLVSSSSAPAYFLRDDGMTRGFPLPLGLPEERARAIDDMPFEFLVLDYQPSGATPTIEDLLQLQSAISQVGRHIFLRAASCPSDTELQLLRDAPVDALLMDAEGVSAETFEEVKSALGRLEPRKSKGPKEGVLLPHGARASGYEDEGDEGDGDEDWDDPE